MRPLGIPPLRDFSWSETLTDRGRPSEYEPAFAEQAAKLCELGATDYELADFFHVDTRTIYRWKNSHEDFCQAVKVGKDKADERVERALFNRAVGYSFESEKVFQFQGEIVRAPLVEHVPPDPGAAFNWLKNRRPDTWRDKTTQEVTGANGAPLVPVINLTGRPESPSAPEAVASVRNKGD